MLITWTSCGKLIIVFSRSYFCLNQSACRPERTIHKTKPSFHPEYRYIFCRLSRRSRQIIRRALEIIYSFLLLLVSFSYVNDSASSWPCCWQHSPLFSFSFECVPQHFFGSIGTFHTPLSHQQWLLLNHTYTSDTDIFPAYQNGLPQNNGKGNCNFCI